MGTGPGSLKPARAQSMTAPHSALQAYSQTAEGRQYLRDHVTRDDDEQGTYQLVAPHSYTVVAVDDEYVTLRNPWGHNKPADGYQPPAGDRPDGLIRITREEYEQHFNCTDIGSTPR